MKEDRGMEKDEGERIVCRAKKSPHCYDGRLSIGRYGEEGMSDDSTFDGESVVCDACYIAAGMPVVGPWGDPATLCDGEGRDGAGR